MLYCSGWILKLVCFCAMRSTAGNSAAEVLDVGGIGADGVEQRLTLIAVALVAHVENVFQFRVVREHAIVKWAVSFGPVAASRGIVDFTVAMVWLSSMEALLLRS